MLVVTPFFGLNTSYAGKSADSLTRWGMEAGPGIIFNKWFEEKDPYKVPVSNIELALQYRFGLSHDRADNISLSLYWSF